MTWFSATLETKIIIDVPSEKVREVVSVLTTVATHRARQQTVTRNSASTSTAYQQRHTDFIIKSTTATRRETKEVVPGIEAEPGDTLAILAGGFVGAAEMLLS